MAPKKAEPKEEEPKTLPCPEPIAAQASSMLGMDLDKYGILAAGLPGWKPPVKPGEVGAPPLQAFPGDELVTLEDGRVLPLKKTICLPPGNKLVPQGKRVKLTAKLRKENTPPPPGVASRPGTRSAPAPNSNSSRPVPPVPASVDNSPRAQDGGSKRCCRLCDARFVVTSRAVRYFDKQGWQPRTCCYKCTTAKKQAAAAAARAMAEQLKQERRPRSRSEDPTPPAVEGGTRPTAGASAAQANHDTRPTAGATAPANDDTRPTAGATRQTAEAPARADDVTQIVLIDRDIYNMHEDKLLDDLIFHASLALEDEWQPNTGCDVLSVAVWIVCMERGRTASKFAAQCIACNHEPSTALEEMRRWLAKYFMPERRAWFVDLPVHLQERLECAPPRSSRISPLTRP